MLFLTRAHSRPRSQLSAVVPKPNPITSDRLSKYVLHDIGHGEDSVGLMVAIAGDSAQNPQLGVNECDGDMWVSRLLSELGHEVIVAHARSVRLIAESRKKDDRLDAQTLVVTRFFIRACDGSFPKRKNPVQT
jgi:hypothetical protein